MPVKISDFLMSTSKWNPAYWGIYVMAHKKLWLPVAIGFGVLVGWLFGD